MNNELPTTALGTLNLFPETKAQQNLFFEKMKAEVLDGNADPLKAEALIVNLESVCKKYRADKELKECLLKEVEKYGKEAKLYNATFSVKEVGVKYDFSLCNRPDYARLLEMYESIKNDLKALETELKAHTKPYVFIDSETGEQCECFPPAKMSTTSVTVEINK